MKFYASLINFRFFLGSQLAKPRVAISRDWLARVAQKDSKLFSAYQNFLAKKTSLIELALKLPHIAAIGDSITTDSYVASLPKMFWKTWAGKKGNWFLETDRSRGIKSIFERINAQIPLIAVQHSTPASRVTGRRTFIDKLLNRKSMTCQVDEVLSQSKFPDMLLIWTGHSAIDWAGSVALKDNAKLDSELNNIAKQFQENFEEQLKRLCDAAVNQNRKIVIIVFGFISLRVLFKLRDAAEIKKNGNPSLFPYFEKTYHMFKSLRPKYREQTILLADKMNRELADIVASCRKKYKRCSAFRIIYSEDLSKAITGSIECVSSSDAWHPSPEGQRQIAEAAWPVIQKQLEFLKLK